MTVAIPTWLDEILNKIRGQSTPQSLTEEDQQIIRRAEVLEAIAGTLGWKEILNLLEKHCDVALSQLKADRTHTPMTSMGLQMRWQEREEVLDYLQKEVYGLIETKRQLLVAQQPEEEEVPTWPKR